MATAAIAPARQCPAIPYVDPADVPDLYAMRGDGTCMEPLFPDGTLLVGDKRETPRPGDAVIIHFNREAAQRHGIPGLIKRLVSPLPPAAFNVIEAFIVIEQLNPPRSYTLSINEIAAIHKCVGTAVSDGKGKAIYRLPKTEGR